MYTDKEEQKAYEAAKKRVEKERDFYIHLVVYVVINIAILFFKEKILVFIEPDEKDAVFFTWWNFGNIITPVAWGVGLLLHGLWAFEKTPLFGKKWEEKKIQKLMKEDDIN